MNSTKHIFREEGYHSQSEWHHSASGWCTSGRESSRHWRMSAERKAQVWFLTQGTCPSAKGIAHAQGAPQPCRPPAWSSHGQVWAPQMCFKPGILLTNCKWSFSSWSKYVNEVPEVRNLGCSWVFSSKPARAVNIGEKLLQLFQLLSWEWALHQIPNKTRASPKAWSFIKAYNIGKGNGNTQRSRYFSGITVVSKPMLSKTPFISTKGLSPKRCTCSFFSMLQTVSLGLKKLNYPCKVQKMCFTAENKHLRCLSCLHSEGNP